MSVCAFAYVCDWVGVCECVPDVVKTGAAFLLSSAASQSHYTVPGQLLLMLSSGQSRLRELKQGSRLSLSSPDCRRGMGGGRYRIILAHTSLLPPAGR